MRFRKGAQLDTSQVEDLRGSGRTGRIPGGGLTVGGGGLGLVVVVVALLFGVNIGGGSGLGSLSGLEDITAGSPTADNTELEASCRTAEDANTREDCRMVGYVNSIQAYWADAFARSGERYTPATTRFFSGQVSTGCGAATSASGPFYCPADRFVYVDLDFFNDLRTKFGAQGGPFAQAYVLAHEYGHHVQGLLGILGRSSSEQGAQGRSVRVELQADCLAGVWARNAVATGYLTEPTEADIADGLDAAAAVGDDRIQEATQGRVTPDSWTHGSAAQRQRWFTTGYRAGTVGSCDTFRGDV